MTLENPERFAKSRDVGPYLGLVPKQEDSGESQPQLGISKAGDTMVRRLLVGTWIYHVSVSLATRWVDKQRHGPAWNTSYSKRVRALMDLTHFFTCGQSRAENRSCSL
ncbi:MAG: hypothetical protein DMG82_23370 [Acidobacteria bacterium]|nr:MAG: hypothetical protein DMG82_23370 [Acidobacteriota bacterium]